MFVLPGHEVPSHRQSPGCSWLTRFRCRSETTSSTWLQPIADRLPVDFDCSQSLIRTCLIDFDCSQLLTRDVQPINYAHSVCERRENVYRKAGEPHTGDDTLPHTKCQVLYLWGHVEKKREQLIGSLLSAATLFELRGHPKCPHSPKCPRNVST